MSPRDEKLEQLQTRLTHLERYEQAFKRELEDIRRQIRQLRSESAAGKTVPPTPPTPRPAPRPAPERKAAPTSSAEGSPPPRPGKVPPGASSIPPPSFDTTTGARSRSEIEKFIGENLISKIGIVILLIGVVIGTKYAIDNNLISPLMRIIFGYAVGFALIGLAVRLRSKYVNYSAVLMSGGMAAMYFVTYFAYSYYALLSQVSAFALMVIFTVFTVTSAILYDRQIIAHIGLVGAYAIPFLLSEDTGRVEILFGYMAFINLGILAVSVRKYWKPLFFTAFIFTWLIYAGWFYSDYLRSDHFSLALGYAFAFFGIFYLTFIAYKVINREAFRAENVALVLTNSLLFYGFGYQILDTPAWDSTLGLFTILNAFIHFAVGVLIYRFKLGDRTAFYLIIALVLTFLTISVPVQFDGQWVTLLWIGEAVFLFAIGRYRKIPLFESYSYPLTALACLSLLIIWTDPFFDYRVWQESGYLPFLNEVFVTGLFTSLGLGLLTYLLFRGPAGNFSANEVENLARFVLPAVFLLFIYNTFRVEIANHFHHVEFLEQTLIDNPPDGLYVVDYATRTLSFAWQLNYSMLFLTLLAVIDLRWIKSRVLGLTTLGLNNLTIGFFITFGMVALQELAGLYDNQAILPGAGPHANLLWIRYVSYACLAGLFVTAFVYARQNRLHQTISRQTLVTVQEVILAFSLLVLLSAELIVWSRLFDVTEVYKFGLSILFGSYAVALIVLGIMYRRTHLRFMAIGLIGFTLLKLFVYDLAELETIPRTVVFVSIGALLLVISFLYTKYRSVLFDEE